MRILVADPTSSDHRQMFDVHSAIDRFKDVSEDYLHEQLRAFLVSMSKVMSDPPEKCGPFDVTEFEVVVQVSASGGIELVGKVGTEISGGITIRLTRANK